MPERSPAAASDPRLFAPSAHKPVLALDTSTPDLVTGIVAESVSDRIVADTRAHNELLVPTIHALVAEAGYQLSDLAAIVVGCGPGPFTGLRVGMATASALGHALGIPVHGVCSHDAIAWQAAHMMKTESSNAESRNAEPSDAGKLVVATDARRKETYYAQYRLDTAQRVEGPAVAAPETLDISAEAVVAADSIVEKLPAPLRSAKVAAPAAPRAEGLVAVADLSSAPSPLVPMYLRRPDAKVPAQQRRSPAVLMGNTLESGRHD